MGLTEELLTHYKQQIASLRLEPSDGGCFEVTVDGQLLFSKLERDRFPEPGEVLGMVRKVSA